MKKILITTLTMLTLLTSAAAFSAATQAPVKQITQPATIDLYASPNASSKIVKKIPIDSDLAIIFHKDGWVEVGDHTTGVTGWLSLKQYQSAKQSFYQSHFRANVNTLFIQMAKNKNGKITVEAYRNGKKLSEKEANKLYQHMRVQQEMQWKTIAHFNHMLTHEVDRDFMLEKRGMDNIFEMPAAFPGIIVIENSGNTITENKNPVAQKAK